MPNGNNGSIENEKSRESQPPAYSDGPPQLEDAIYLANPFTNRQAPDVTRYLVFVLPGNPGLIEYYRPFMKRLYGTLEDREYGEAEEKKRIVWEVCGRSMGGFELSHVPKEDVREDDKTKSGWLKRLKFWEKSHKVYGLKEQIVFLERRLRQTVRGQKNIKVVLVGHSVGAYILMELIRRHRERLETLSRQERASVLQDDEPDIVGGICLFPTVMNIKDSSKGKQFVSITRFVGGTPFMPYVLSGLCRLIVLLLPLTILEALVGRMSSLSDRASEITVGWLRSKTGVRQGLHMARDEMSEITMDKWDSEIWGAVHPSPTQVPRPRMFFYFGEKDHWVADHTRDDLIRLRGRGDGGDDWKPWMEIDRFNIPHGFCIDHSVPIADRVREYLESIVEVANGGEGKLTLPEKRLSTSTFTTGQTSSFG